MSSASFSKSAVVTPVVQAAAYGANDLVGGKLTLVDASRLPRTGVILSVTLTDKAAQNAATDIFFFSGDPSATTFTENSALTLNDADLAKCLGHVSIAATDYKALAANSVACVKNVGLHFQLDAGQTLYAAMVTRGTPTYASTSDLQLRVGILQDHQGNV